MLALATITYLTLLVTSGWASMCSDADGMNDELRQVFVDQHNMYRSQIAKGQAKNKLGWLRSKGGKDAEDGTTAMVSSIFLRLK
ncbi:hypothetical protein OSTOST_20975 [Ostertagia ostertagi]